MNFQQLSIFYTKQTVGKVINAESYKVFSSPTIFRFKCKFNNFDNTVYRMTTYSGNLEFKKKGK